MINQDFLQGEIKEIKKSCKNELNVSIFFRSLHTWALVWQNPITRMQYCHFSHMGLQPSQMFALKTRGYWTVKCLEHPYKTSFSHNPVWTRMPIPISSPCTGSQFQLKLEKRAASFYASVDSSTLNVKCLALSLLLALFFAYCLRSYGFVHCLCVLCFLVVLNPDQSIRIHISPNWPLVISPWLSH